MLDKFCLETVDLVTTLWNATLTGELAYDFPNIWS
jgi:hypothetical protein